MTVSRLMYYYTEQLHNTHMNLLRLKEEVKFLAKNDFCVPSQTQLNNILAKMRKKKFGVTNISLGELKKWLIENSPVPKDEMMKNSFSDSLLQPNVCLVLPKMQRSSMLMLLTNLFGKAIQFLLLVYLILTAIFIILA